MANRNNFMKENRAMIYTVWTDGNGEKIQLEDMSDKHIKNCVKMLEKVLRSVKNKEYDPQKPEPVMSDNWVLKHGESFLEAFEREKLIRKRVAKEDYPTVKIHPTCKNCCQHCDWQILELDNVCEKWEPHDIAIQEALQDEIDREVAHRLGGCNVTQI